MQRVATQICVRTAFFLYLFQYVVAGGVVDDKLVVCPGIGTIHLQIKPTPCDHLVKEGFQRDLFQHFIGYLFSEQEHIVLTVQFDISSVRADTLQPTAEFALHTAFLISEHDAHGITALQFVFHLKRVVVLRRRKCYDSGI